MKLVFYEIYVAIDVLHYMTVVINAKKSTLQTQCIVLCIYVSGCEMKIYATEATKILQPQQSDCLDDKLSFLSN